MERRGGQAGWSDGQIIAPMVINLGSWKCSAGGDCVLPLVKSAKFCFHVRPQLCALTHPVIHLRLGPQKPDPPFPLAAGETEVQRRVWMSQGDIDHVMSLRGQYLNSRLTSPGQHLPLEPPAWEQPGAVCRLWLCTIYARGQVGSQGEGPGVLRMWRDPVWCSFPGSSQGWWRRGACGFGSEGGKLARQGGTEVDTGITVNLLSR